MFHRSSKDSSCTACTSMDILLSIFAAIASVFALVGTWYAHALPQGFTFGTIEASMSLIALSVTLLFAKKMTSCCACGVKKK